MAWDAFFPSLWGLGGALCWAGPQLSSCLKTCPGGWACKADCAWEFAIALFAGALFAPSFGEVLGHYVHWLVEPKPYALWVSIGLAAYPCSPLLLRGIKGEMARRMKVPTE